MEIIVIAAISENDVIGKDGKLPWHIPEDLKHFKELTTGHSVIMGRKTFDSIGKALPGRKNVVITHNPDFHAPDIIVCHSFKEAIDACRHGKKTFVIGGQSVFLEALEVAKRLELTRVHRKIDGNVHFPEIDWAEWEEISREDHGEYSFVTYVRK